MHIIAKFAYDHGARKFGIVYDSKYRFGPEGAGAFNAEVHRLTGSDIPGYSPQGCNKQYCGVDSSQTGGFSTAITTFDQACNPCDAVVMLLEPAPVEAWMSGEQNQSSAWYKTLFGGEPLFDDNVANNCPGCGRAPMYVWTGYHPAIQPFASEAAVAQYKNSLLAVRPSDDPHNEFTEGAYLGTKLFIAAVKKVGANNAPLTRGNLQAAINGNSYDLGLSSSAINYNGGGVPHLANTGMAEFGENYSGSFNGWSYQSTGFIQDPAKGQDLS
jgi:ABC-type branched-subunit amino acid transport system substrate-binding protein